MTTAPNHLQAETRKWVNKLLGEWEFEDRHKRILVLAAECWDRLESIRKDMKDKPLTVSDRYGMPKTHPLLVEERAQKRLFTQLIRELGLDLEVPEPPRAPRTGGASAGAKAGGSKK